MWSLRPPSHPVTAALLRSMMKETCCVKRFRLTRLSCFIVIKLVCMQGLVYFTDECRGVTVKWQDWFCEVMLCGECTYFGLFNGSSVTQYIYVCSRIKGVGRCGLEFYSPGIYFVGAEEYHERCLSGWQLGTKWSEYAGIPLLAFLTSINCVTEVPQWNVQILLLSHLLCFTARTASTRWHENLIFRCCFGRTYLSFTICAKLERHSLS